MLIERENYVILELHLTAWFSLGFGAIHLISDAWMSSEVKPPRLLLGKVTDQWAALKMIQRRCLPTPASPACSPLCRCKHAMKWGETVVNQLCSCFITLLISILIFVGFRFQSIRLEVRIVHTLVFGKGICEPALEAPPLLLPSWHHAKIWFKPKKAGREEGK